MGRKIGGAVPILLFVGLWTAVTGGFDAFLGYNAYRQVQAGKYPTVRGVITHSEVSRHSGSKGGTTYGVEVEYTYEVNGAEYSSNRYRYGQVSTSAYRSVSKTVHSLPVGKHVDVRYNPADPGDAVLVAGIGGTDLMLALFLTPFNIVMLAGWFFLAQTIYFAVLKPPAGGAPVIRRPNRLHIRLPRISPLGAGAATALGISFASVFVMAFGFSFNPPIGLVGGVCAGSLACAAVVYLWRRLVAGSGTRDLVIDDVSRTLSLPQTFGRKSDVVVPIDAVTSLEVEKIEQVGSKSKTTSYAPTLVYSDGSGEQQRAKLAQWSDQGRAESLAAFIRDWIGLSGSASGDALRPEAA